MCSVGTLTLLLSWLLVQNPDAGLTGRVLDSTGRGVSGTRAELHSGSGDFIRTRADGEGVYRFDSLPPGDYTLKLQSPGFATLSVKSIHVVGGEQRSLLSLELSVSMCGSDAVREYRALEPGVRTGTIAGIVSVWNPRNAHLVKAADVTLVCGNKTCGTTKTNAPGEFRFADLAPGDYGFRVRHAGYYPREEPGTYRVVEGLEAAHSISLEPCLPGRCDPQYRPKKAIAICE